MPSQSMPSQNMPSQSMPSQNMPFNSRCCHQTRSECRLSYQISVTSPISLEEAVKLFIPYHRDCCGNTRFEAYIDIYARMENLCYRGMIQDISIFDSDFDSDDLYFAINEIFHMYWSS